MNNTYKNVEVFERTKITPQGKVAKIYKVTAVTLTGTLFSVDVEEHDFNKVKVAEILASRAAEINEIIALGS